MGLIITKESLWRWEQWQFYKIKKADQDGRR